MQDPYTVLGVSRSDSDEDIARAYRNLARKYHPDVNGGSAYAEEKFKQINAAYSQIKAERQNGTNAQNNYGNTYGNQYSETYTRPHTFYYSSGYYRPAPRRGFLHIILRFILIIFVLRIVAFLISSLISGALYGRYGNYGQNFGNDTKIEWNKGDNT